MNCSACKTNKIGPKTAPFGGFLCGNEHIQCEECNAKTDGLCGICAQSTNFVQMNFNKHQGQPSPTPSLPNDCDDQLERGSTTRPMAASPVSDSQPPEVDIHSSYVFPKAFFEEIQQQASISQEHLSMHDSHESLSDAGPDNAQDAKQEQETELLTFRKSLTDFTENSVRPATEISGPATVAMSEYQSSVSPAEGAEMETLFFGGHQQHKSASNFLFQLGSGKKNRGVNSECGGDHLEHDQCEEIGDGAKKTSEQDTEEVIHTSEIRFMESTESMKNYYSGGTNHPILKMTHDTTQKELLSVKMLQEFECQNTVTPCELVENYLRSYVPMALYQFPVYSFSQNANDGECPPKHNSNGHPLSTYMCSVSVSTESEPSLAAVCGAPKHDFRPRDYLVMQSTGVAAPKPGIFPKTDKTSRPSIDMRMQKVLETFQENPRQTQISEHPLLEQTKNFTKVPPPVKAAAPPVPAPVPIPVPAIQPVSPLKEVPSNDTESSALLAQLSNSHRAFYNPPLNVRERSAPLAPVPSVHPCNEPPPQFQLISCSNLMSTELMSSKARLINMKPMPASQLTIPRTPIQCPESSCRRMIFVSDFNKHLVVDHSMLPMERIAPRQCKNFFLDPRLAHNGVSKCHLLYLLRDKITDLGSSKFKDFLPLLVMSARIRLSEMCGLDPREHIKFVTSENNVEFLMIWLTGIMPEEFPVAVSLTVWPRSGQVPTCHVVHSGKMYSVRKSQKAIDVCQSGQMLLLSSSEVELLTNGGKEMLELQIVVY